ncbi:MAG: glycine cleavage system aminomethyltransferase GcvT [Actinomycetota bacterium]
MPEGDASDTRATSLKERHQDLGARFVEFAGWEMPVRYGSLLEEHRAVRERAGLFDVSHMGEFWITGPGAAAGLSFALVSDPASLAAGKAEYSMICAPDGGILDDLIVYRAEPERFLVVANAANREVVGRELRARMAGRDATVEDSSDETGMIAIQGPRSREILSMLTRTNLARLRTYWIIPGLVAGRRTLIARTGYTGEDGYELFTKWEDGPVVWDALLEAGERFDIMPVGLGARDTLRLEAGMPLYGNELDAETTPFEAGLGHVVKFDKLGDFVGRDALFGVRTHPRRGPIGLVLHGRMIARHGEPVFLPGTETPCGHITSGAPSPTLGAPIAMASLNIDTPEPGTLFEVEIRGQREQAETVTLPFYRRTKEEQA